MQASDVSTAQTLSVTVFNPTPAGGTSNAEDFVIHPVIAAGDIAGETEVCEGAQGITYSVAAGAAAYNWTVGPGATIESGGTTNEITVRFGNTASTVNISVEAVNACGVAGPPSDIDVTVTPYPTGITAGPAEGVQFCTGTSATLGSGDPAVPGYTYQWSPVEGLSDPNDPNPTITLTNSTQTARFETYTLTVTNGNAACAVSDQVLVTVYPELIIEADDVEPVCIGNQIELRVTGAASYTYAWTGPDGFTSSVQNPVIADATEANEGTYTVVVTNQQGCEATADVEVTIAPLPTANAGADQSLCSQGASTSFSVTGTPSAGAAGTWSVISGTATIVSPTSLTTQVNVSSANATLRFTAETPAGCQASDDVVLTVDPLPTVTLAPLSAICESDAPITLTGGLPAGGTYSGPGVTNGVFDPVAAGGDGTYTITYTYSDGNDCESTATRTITVKPQPVVSVTPDTEICFGESVELTANGATTYRWEPAAGLSATTGASVIANPTTTTTYTVYGTTNGCESVAQTVTVTVNPLPNVAITPTGPTEFCDGNYVDLVAENKTGYTYEWFDASAGTPVGSASTYRAEDSGSYYVTITTDKGCALTSEPVSVIVAKLPNEATITAGTTTFCQGGSVQISANSAPSGQTYEYVWESSSNNVDFTPIAGVPVTADSYLAETSGYYRVKVSDVSEGTVSDCFKTSQSIQVTVLPQPTADITSSAETQCRAASGATTFTVTGTFSGGTAVWTSSNSNFSIGDRNDVPNPSTGVTTSTVTVSVPASAVTSVISSNITLRATNAAASCDPASDQVTLTVQPLIAGNTITGTNAYCQGAVATALSSGTLSGGNGSYTYTWEQSANNSTWGSAAGTNNQASYKPTTATGGTMYYRRTVTSGECESISAAFAVTVTPSITTNNIAGTQNYCEDEPATALGGAVAGGTGSYTYQWQSSSSAGGTFSNIPSATAATYTPPTATGGTVYYRRLVTSGECQGNISNVIGVTVTPAITTNSISGTTTYCQGATASSLGGTVTGGISAKTYRWEQSPNGTGSWTIAAGTSNLISYTPSTATVGTMHYRRVVTSQNCSDISNMVAVTVNAPIAGNQISGDQTVCSGGAKAALGQASGTSLSGGSTPYGYQWQSSSSATGTFTNIGGATSASYTPPTTTVSTITTTYYRRVVDGGQCASISAPVAVTVTPVITSNTITGAQTICAQGTPTQLTGSTPTGGTGSYTYQWQQSTNNSTWVNATGPNSSTGVNYQPGALTTTTYFRRVVSSGTCNDLPSASVKVTVNPLPTPGFTGVTDGQIIYTGGGNITLAGSPGGGTFSGSGVSGNTFNPCTAGAGQKTITYTVTNGNGCTNSVSKTVTVRESQYRVVVISNPKPFCQGDNVDHEAWVVRDAQSIIYPYLTNANGDPVDESGRLIGTTELPVSNPAYPFPAGTSDIVKQFAFRYFNPIITLGANGERITSGLTYQWTKNQQNEIGKNQITFSNAGLSSLDYYAVKVSSGTSSCGPNLNNTLSSRTYTSQLYNYDMTLAASKNPICPGESVTFTATLNSAFPFWNSINLVLQWQVNGVTQYTSSYGTGNAAALQWTTTGPAGGFKQGDVVAIRFTSDVDGGSLAAGSKCASGTNSAVVTMNVNVVPAITGTTVNAACVGSVATLSVNATGTGLAYQWYKRPGNSSTAGTALSNGGRISGATSANLSIANTTATDAGLYYVEVSGACPPMVASQDLQLNITPVPLAYNVTAPNGTAYCAGGSGTVIGMSNSQAGVTYSLYRSGSSTALISINRTASGAFNFPNSYTAGTYSVVATPTGTQPAVASCPQNMLNTVTITTNPLPAAITATGGSYCSPTVEFPNSGALVTLAGTQSGVSYQLINASNQPVGSAANGNGGQIDLGPVVAGTYNIRATNTTTGCTNTVGQATVTMTERVEPLGDIIITNESGEVITEQQLETGQYARFTASTTFGDDNTAETYTWYIGDGIEANWQVVPGVEGPVLTIDSVPGGDFAVRVEVTADPSACYTDYLGIYSTTPVVPLPVEIIYFNAAKQGNNVLLEWATASEQNNTGFEVQVSQDGFNFRKLDFVPTKNGNTVLKQVYQYTDKENGKRGTRYYRLKQIDEDGKFEYFTTKAVTFTEVASKVKAFPNPFSTNLTLDVAAENSGEVHISMANAIGRQIMERTVKVEEGFNTIYLNMNGDLPHGVYFIRVYLDGKMHQLKLLKE
ncbi:T9SS type A sorting domain-containing protein [Pontibacter anaerobius]|uniref:T9SS type A sorting domain-containing protein n=1 Tax=Pontibacter anaerobius TaxID=2993940 RepID=A0ABT3RBN6_9BACT|nr:T9SS type A sorting domain-containing protein [Pontibacter anaerobius]MCX2738927.1 T9SS type A sorting domain-containing protein [Pontibacter anaerobius]